MGQFDQININIGGPQESPATYKEVVLKGNLPFASQVNEENKKYIIKWNFDLNGETVTIPERCILDFDGGSVNNGNLELSSDTIVIDFLHSVGELDNRPAIKHIGFMFFDKTVGKPIWWDGTNWVDATGQTV